MQIISSRYSTVKSSQLRRWLSAATCLWMIHYLPASAADVTLKPGSETVTASIAHTAIRFAAGALEQAREAGNVWLSSGQQLAAAQRDLDNGDYAQALALATIVQRHARLALNQYRLERARYLLGTLDLEEKSDTRSAIVGLLQANDGAGALLVVQEFLCAQAFNEPPPDCR